MTAYGQTVRRLRLGQGLPQKAVYSGIVSRSFYAKFEKGQTNIGADKLFEILRRLTISPNEFLFQHRGMRPPAIQQLSKQIDQDYQAGDLQALRDFYTANRYHRLPEMRALALRAYTGVYTANQNILHMSNAPIAEVQALLAQTPQWTLSQARLIIETNLLIPLSNPQHQAFFRQAVATLRDYLAFDDQVANDLGGAYLNEIQTQLIAGRLPAAATLAAELQTLSAQIAATTIKLTAAFCQYLIGLYTDYPAVEPQLTTFLAWCKQLNLPDTRDFGLIATVHRDRGRNHYDRHQYFNHRE
ncbi:helix-turn-helix domain-containing protein [Schleiferilactobacillus harbinensis]|jgi:transcriptional regulator with XRE-family HTH domain|uniref:helix-turn-helix domain-containing protein n=1 Tax=Schleiferilactobacillus harbinensis TaxID=304207 RepID=UPI00242CDD49|nr:helix-turn-helix transcriptional regulator [Schleiferilactobacillus harbinensis]MCI1686633.1 helix-turn-helix domain-containing protein [Schleiferilactobacillus harbinensis]MCI1784064.1 helix-turn-helix domain-containing protein [Schleiferilactobacillus harbinensis]MCI1849405.1 helix-turn-helix domain-containing protein [Schleiferilactobacillus harbinensis]